ncbi:type II toxin-antitoxin system HipA family toxin [Starkeya sp. 3C]|jgi:serine/threonine-protein kinase HipA|uniref:Type II toxin-antitoxin system HipA family toxin n=1 Tax=Ancylobacter moscoviensis TaxID=2597768 RepID=A0ABY3DWG6_9HYPH|nr:type II toxin-antitoxin system HipA family toxin [Ancylobacter moscoviensis]TSJ64146.1 type II toxin-antitoxin system HipA family toxin [Ancylobacter moscoviensis]
MTDRLVVLADGHIMGEVRRSRSGRLAFVYHDGWRRSSNAYPLSLSMPLVVAEHEHGRIEPWLWGLLPDNEAILARWGQRFQVSPRNAFALLGAVGEDCAGAIQLAPSERVPTLMEADQGFVAWLSSSDIAERLALLRKDQSAWRVARDAGQFSLAGAQPKTALLFDGERWGIPSGRMATTHILKPPIDAFDGHAENEHLCLALSRALGFPAARSRVMRFDDEMAIVVERYDRQRTAAGIRRLHQEDVCQALGLPPTKKYQNEGGPALGEMLEVIRAYSGVPQEDEWTFARALIFNWLIGGTDAHAKNFSMLIGAGGRARLAPLYDVASTLVYDFDPRKLKLANRIGGAYLIEDIGPRQWEQFAVETRLPKQDVLNAARAMASALPAAIHAVADQARSEGLDHPVIPRMVDILSARAERCARLFPD